MAINRNDGPAHGATGGNVCSALLDGSRAFYADAETWLLGDGGPRGFDPEVGRFIKEDPIRYDSGDINFFRPMGNDPINKSDPSGNQALTPAERAEWIEQRGREIASHSRSHDTFQSSFFDSEGYQHSMIYEWHHTSGTNYAFSYTDSNEGGYVAVRSFVNSPEDTEKWFWQYLGGTGTPTAPPQKDGSTVNMALEANNDPLRSEMMRHLEIAHLDPAKIGNRVWALRVLSLEKDVREAQEAYDKLNPPAEVGPADTGNPRDFAAIEEAHDNLLVLSAAFAAAIDRVPIEQFVGDRVAEAEISGRVAASELEQKTKIADSARYTTNSALSDALKEHNSSRPPPPPTPTPPESPEATPKPTAGLATARDEVTPATPTATSGLNATPGPIVPLAPARPVNAGTLKTSSVGSAEPPSTGESGLKSVGDHMPVAKNGSVWKVPATERGVAIEKQLAATEYKGWFHIGAEDGGTFPLVDFQKGQTLVSLKTVDTTGTRWLRTMQNHIEDLGSRGVTVNGQPANMVLDLRVQPGGTGAAQSLVNYGQKFGVQVIIREYP